MLEFPYYDLMITITKNKSDDWLFVDLINDEFVFTKGDEYIKIILNKEIEFRGATLADFRVILEEKYEIGLLEMSVEPVVKTIDGVNHRIKIELKPKKVSRMKDTNWFLEDKFAYRDCMSKITQDNYDGWVFDRSNENKYSFHKGEFMLNVMIDKPIVFDGINLLDFECTVESNYDIQFEFDSVCEDNSIITYDIKLKLTDSIFR